MVESRKGAVPESYCMPTRFPSPLIKPDVPVSSIRLSDRLHQLAHGSGPRCTSRSRSTPNFPNTIAFEKLMAPRDDTLWRCLRKFLTRYDCGVFQPVTRSRVQR